MLLNTYVAETLARHRQAEIQAAVRTNWLLRALRQSPAEPAGAAARAAADGLCCQECTCAAA